MDRPRLLSPRQLAAAIDASESSIKRWADEGLIKAAKTAGGHRRITLAEVLRFIRSAKIPVVRADLLGLPTIERTGDALERVGPRLFDALLQGDTEQVRALLIGLFVDGHSLGAIGDGPVQFAMAQIGELWQREPRGIDIEHRATEICAQATSELRSLLSPEPNAALAVGGTVGGDRSALASQWVAATLEGLGMRTINLGADTPWESIERMALEQKPRLIWVSFTHPVAASIAPTQDLITRLAKQQGLQCVVGGNAAELLHLPHLPNLHRLRFLAQLETLARGIVAEGS